MINSGDKFVIEIEAVYGRADGGSEGSVPTLYRANGFRSLVFDEEGLKKLVPLDQMRPSWWEEIYQRGLDDAWGLAKRLIRNTSPHDLRRMGFGDSIRHENLDEIVLNNFTASEALAKIREYEENKKAEAEAIKVGDEVITGTDRGIVTSTTNEGCYICLANGYIRHYVKLDVKKTGRHFPQIAEVLGELTNNE